MEIYLSGSYKKYFLKQRENIIELHNKETGHIKDFMKVSHYNNTPSYFYLTPIIDRKENKKIRKFIHRQWSTHQNMCYGLDDNETLSNFLMKLSKELRDYKLQELI